MKEYPWGRGTVRWARDATADNSNKSFTVPAGKIWKMLNIGLRFATTATVGTRVIRIRIFPDGTNLSHEAVFSNTPPSTTNVFYCAFNGTPTALGTAAGSHNFSDMILNAGAVIQILDTAVIDPAADDLTVNLHYMEYDA